MGGPPIQTRWLKLASPWLSLLIKLSPWKITQEAKESSEMGKEESNIVWDLRIEEVTQQQCFYIPILSQEGDSSTVLPDLNLAKKAAQVISSSPSPHPTESKEITSDKAR